MRGFHSAQNRFAGSSWLLRIFRGCDAKMPVVDGRFQESAGLPRRMNGAAIMEENVQKSCWGTTAWAVAGFACIMVVVYLLGMNDVSEVSAILPR